MRFLNALPAALLAALSVLAPASAQTTFFSVQPNETKDQATPALGMVDGDILSVPIGCPPFYDPEIFRVRTAPLAPGIYRQRLVPIQLAIGNYPTILGRSQFNGQIDEDSTVVVQQAVDQTSPTRFLQWYGFGESEEIYVDLDDTLDCRTSFDMQLETTPVTPTPVASGANPGNTLFVTTTASSPTTDVDLWLFDADFDALPGSGERVTFNGAPEVAAAVTEGTYYLGVSQGPFHHHQAAAISDAFDSDDVLDFRGAAVSGRRDVGATVELRIGTATVQATFTEPYEIHWFRIDVGTGQNAMAFCVGDGTDGACPCGPSPAGQGAGCLNSTGRGARLYAHGSLRFFDVRYEMEDLPPFTTVVLFAGLSTSSGTPFYAGNLCLGTGLVRIGPFQADALGRASEDSGTVFFNAGFMTGSTVYCQAVYRDAVGGTGCLGNATNGAVVTIR